MQLPYRGMWIRHDSATGGGCRCVTSRTRQRSELPRILRLEDEQIIADLMPMIIEEEGVGGHPGLHADGEPFLAAPMLVTAHADSAPR